MLAVAIGANGYVGLAAPGQFAVDPLPVIAFDSPMALAARTRDVEVVDTRFYAPRREDLVGRSSGGVAVVACRRNVNAALGRPPVNRRLVNLYWMIDQYVVLRGDVEVFVALATGLREVHRVNC